MLPWQRSILRLRKAIYGLRCKGCVKTRLSGNRDVEALVQVSRMGTGNPCLLTALEPLDRFENLLILLQLIGCLDHLYQHCRNGRLLHHGHRGIQSALLEIP
jgi:hypothetical protein